MPTFVSMLTWHGEPRPRPADVRAAIDERAFELAAAGLRSIVFLPDDGACVAVIVSSGEGADVPGRIADAILPRAAVRVESMQFDDAEILVRAGREVVPPPPAAWPGAVSEDVVSG